ncbi:DUF4431 domain-containing protein [Nissabacter archeti]|uniref:DUF4431 domain-containing protein n=1 Tax=Nissabacter archeti TaxID=1917880 RepID=A0ABS5JCZ1_9GAMM|nr:DUF4431 domain-containing protein [Nissabacter archeti]MBS0967815.1 DUF4431 domain-containing protein [Nissabacter archeti]
MRSIILTFCALFACFSHADCFKNGDAVTLTGMLVSKTYQSPEDIPEPINKLVLELDEPLDCMVDVDKTFESWGKDITIFPPHAEKYKNIESLMYKHVRVSGKLVLAVTAYNFTAILLLANEMTIISN